MLHVHFLPSLTTPQELAGGLVVVIDVLRATTTVCHALAAGAKAVVPCMEVQEARDIARRLPEGEVVLGGERRGLRIDGFDLGNSPAEYTQKAIAGRTVVFTTTNGTQALRLCGEARRAVLGAFVNRSAVCDEVVHAMAAGHEAHLLCAGTRGEITGEDVLFTGAAVWRVLNSPGPPREAKLNDQARLAVSAWRAVCAELNANEAVPAGGLDQPVPASELGVYLIRHTQGGRDLAALGLTADVLDASRIDRFDFLPELLLGEWRIIRS
jgi:2-phosphosulfolactate phosphatase